MPNKSNQSKPSRVLGIDPGYGRMGLAILQKNNGKDSVVYSECFETDPKLPHSRRLLSLGERLSEIIERYLPDTLSIETLLFSKNQKTAMQVSEARGVAVFMAAKYGLKIREYNPNQIKIAVTGYGKSDKKQVIGMIEKIIKMEKKKRFDDEYDAIAAAITCLNHSLSTENL